MTSSEIDSIIESITKFKNTRNYWFIRTQGGNYYDSFLLKSYVAIGYDEVNISDIKKATIDDVGRQSLTEIIRTKFPDESRPNYIGNQLIDFSYNIKKGDIVVIPSYSSEYISIGEVTETPIYQETETKQGDECPFSKRKKINWIKTNLFFDSLESKLIKLKYTQRTISKIDEELRAFLDRIIAPLFIKEDDAHLALNVTKKEKIGAYSLFSTWTELLSLTEEFGKQEELDINKEEFDLRINVQSPGTIEFITYSVIGIVALSVIVVAIIGAEFESKTRPLRFSFKSEGLIKKAMDFLDGKKDRLMKDELIKKVKDMEINPDEVAKILEQLNKK